MSTVRDRGIIDITTVEGDRYVLTIIDDMEWNFSIRRQHRKILQDKMNDYLDYIASGQAQEARPGLRPVIRVMAQYSYSRYCLDFLEQVKSFIKNKDDICDLEWSHMDGDGSFQDGFSDDYVFDIDKIYPRLKKNWAKSPFKEISLMAPNDEAPDYSNMVMFRIMDSFIILLMQDMGSAFTYLDYDMLPEDMAPESLQERAFSNLSRDIQYRSCESKEPGIYGILAGGDFEAESLCFPDIWRTVAEELQDDVLIGVPTKDIVLYTKAGDRKLRSKLMKKARDMFEHNRHESPYLLFCRDVFLYSRRDKTLKVSKYKI